MLRFLQKVNWRFSQRRWKQKFNNDHHIKIYVYILHQQESSLFENPQDVERILFMLGVTYTNDFARLVFISRYQVRASTFFYFCVNSQFAGAFTICIWKYSLVVAYLCATIRNANAPTLFCNLQYSCTECKGCNIICKIVNSKGKI